MRGDLGKAVQQIKREPGKGLFVGGVKLPLALADLGLIDEYEFGDGIDELLEDDLLRALGSTSSESQRRWAVFQVARPV